MTTSTFTVTAQAKGISKRGFSLKSALGLATLSKSPIKFTRATTRYSTVISELDARVRACLLAHGLMVINEPEMQFEITAEGRRYLATLKRHQLLTLKLTTKNG